MTVPASKALRPKNKKTGKCRFFYSISSVAMLFNPALWPLRLYTAE